MIEQQLSPDSDALIAFAQTPEALSDLWLPEGYGIKGGAARAVGFLTLTGQEITVRDIDIISLPHADHSLADSIARRHMPHDYAYGNGVESALSPEALLKERDFTLNEVATFGDVLYYTAAAKDAMNKGAIELADGETAGIKLKTKAQLLASALTTQGVEIAVSDELSSISVDPFWSGVMLDRAIEQGDAVANRFFENIKAADRSGEMKVLETVVDFSSWIVDQVSDARFVNVEGLLAPEAEEVFELDMFSEVGRQAIHGSNWVTQDGY